MRIEIDTVHDSKEDLVHLANMLHALTADGPGEVGGSFTDDRFQRRLDKKQNRFHNSENTDRQFGNLTSSSPGQTSAPASGFMNIFGDNTTNQATSQPNTSSVATPTAAPAQSSTGGDIFSIFGGAEESAPRPQESSLPAQPTQGLTMQELLSGATSANEPEEDETPKNVRLVPY